MIFAYLCTHVYLDGDFVAASRRLRPLLRSHGPTQHQAYFKLSRGLGPAIVGGKLLRNFKKNLNKNIIGNNNSYKIDLKFCLKLCLPPFPREVDLTSEGVRQPPPRSS